MNKNETLAYVYVKDGRSKKIGLVISLDWNISYFRIDDRLKEFLKKQQVETLKDFLKKEEDLPKICPENVMQQLEEFHSIVKKIISGPPYPKEVLHKIKKTIPTFRKRPTTSQKAFLNSLYFLGPVMRKTKAYKHHVNERMHELFPNHPNVSRYVA